MVSRPWRPGLPSRERICDVMVGEDILCNVKVFRDKKLGYRRLRVCADTEDGRDTTLLVFVDEAECKWQAIEVPHGA